jgi:hypothetical protein
MTNKEKIEILRVCFDDVIWMAIRYAHGRHTYAPESVRQAIRSYQEVFPNWKPKYDITIDPPEEGEIGGFRFRSDYLDDLVGKKDKCE